MLAVATLVFNGRGLDLSFTMKNFPATVNTLTQRVWCEVAKVISLKDGTRDSEECVRVLHAPVLRCS